MRCYISFIIKMQNLNLLVWTVSLCFHSAILSDTFLFILLTSNKCGRHILSLVKHFQRVFLKVRKGWSDHRKIWLLACCISTTCGTIWNTHAVVVVVTIGLRTRQNDTLKHYLCRTHFCLIVCQLCQNKSLLEKHPNAPQTSHFLQQASVMKGMSKLIG